jgi:hypothetical protein
MRSSIFKFKDASGSTYMISFDWALSRRNSSLSTELEVWINVLNQDWFN